MANCKKGRPMNLFSLIVLVISGCLLPRAASWSTQRYNLWSPTRFMHNVGRPSSHYFATKNGNILTVKASNAVDMDDTKSLEEFEKTYTELSSGSKWDLEDTSYEPSLETALDTAQIDADMREITTKVLNTIFLAVSFGWAAYTILNIDSGMTRGWTQSEIAMRIPLDNWSNYESSLMEKPIFTKTLINVIIYLLGDWLSQTVFQKKNVLDFDVSRTLKNGFIGLCFGPLVHQYYAFSDQILPVEGGLQNRISKILMDQTIYLTVKCSIYIYAVGVLSGNDWRTCKQTVMDKIGGIVVTAWKFWPLVHCITYGVIPARHRILWVNSVDLVWNAILASKAQKEQPENGERDVKTEDIKESAGMLSTSSEPETTELVESLATIRQTMESMSSHDMSESEQQTVQEVTLTGCSIEIPADGEPVLVAGNDEEAKVPIVPNSACDNNTALEDLKLSP